MQDFGVKHAQPCTHAHMHNPVHVNLVLNIQMDCYQWYRDRGGSKIVEGGGQGVKIKKFVC